MERAGSVLIIHTDRCRVDRQEMAPTYAEQPLISSGYQLIHLATLTLT